MQIQEKIKRLRQQRGMTQSELAERVGVSLRSIQNYELGMRYPKRDILDRLCDALEVSLEYLVSSGDRFLMDAEEEGGARGKRAAQQLIDSADALFTGGVLSEEDQDKVMLALQKIYWKTKEKNQKYTPKKYRDEE
ncbi:MAG: helix-turn-helix transcriptional regulator [Ruminococcus sp.]|nr:helix-turn-helix transcriptional regulator [Ruminococcus sp.]MBQ8906042.1 helix-turn-helix transcriptional regulator [Ruminococcus sp.]